MSVLPLTDLVPDPAEEPPALFADQDEATILARWVAWANEGLDPVADADQWVDTREGGHWATVLTPALREIARLYDVMGSEVVMAAFVLWAWEGYLDDLGSVYGVRRHPAVAAQGTETFTGPPGTVIDPGVRIAVTPSSVDDPAPEFEVVSPGGTIPGGGTIDLDVIAVDPGAAGNVPAGSITAQVTPLAVTFTNAAATWGGADAETDDSLRDRILEALGSGTGPGNVRDYVRWAKAITGVGRVQVTPIWRGPGTVLVTVDDVDGQPLPSPVVTAVQDDLDPTAGLGAGTAPVGATVTVETATMLTVDVDVTGMEYEPGYSWDGVGGTLAVAPGITQAIARYFLVVPPGGEVVLAHVAGIFATYPGVHDFGAVTLNGGAANVAVGGDPPEAPELGTLTVS